MLSLPLRRTALRRNSCISNCTLPNWSMENGLKKWICLLYPENWVSPVLCWQWNNKKLSSNSLTIRDARELSSILFNCRYLKTNNSAAPASPPEIHRTVLCCAGSRSIPPPDRTRQHLPPRSLGIGDPRYPPVPNKHKHG